MTDDGDSNNHSRNSTSTKASTSSRNNNTGTGTSSRSRSTSSTSPSATASSRSTSSRTSSKMPGWLPAPLRKQWADGFVAVFLVAVTQAVILALTSVGDRMNNFSAAILGMAVLGALMTALDLGFRLLSSSPEAVQDFYQKHLFAPSNLLNRHMAIGFTVPFVHIFKAAAAASPREIGLITALFVLCGIIFPVAVFGVTYALQSALILARGGRRHRQHTARPAAAPGVLPSSSDRKNRRLSNQSTLIGQRTPRDADEEAASEFHDVPLNDDDDDDDGDGQPPPPPARPSAAAERHPHAARLMDWVLTNVTLYACAVSVPIAVVVASCTDATALLDTSVLFTAWMAAHALQRWVSAPRRSSSRRHHHHHHPRVRTAVAVCLLNPVLVTAAVTVGYIHVRWALRTSKGLPETLRDVVAGFQSGTTLARYVMRRIAARDGPCVGAGDVATSILESGLAAWGFKLFEYRRQLASPTGLVVLVASAVAAVVTIVSAPLLAHLGGAGLATPQSLSFATRSVTLALGTPVLTRLGGDVGANAAMVVFNGVVFQVVMGLGLARWAAARFGAVRDWCSSSCSRRRRRRAGAQDDHRYKEEHGRRRHQPDLEMGDVVHHDDRAAVADLACRLSRQLSSQQQQQPRLSLDLAPNPTNLPIESAPPTTQTARATPPAAASSPGLVAPPTSPEDENIASSGRENVTHQTYNNTPNDSNPTAGATIEDARTVATGVTVGINAAAMGTAYLNETKSPAAPYSALAMTLFGVLTVVFLSVTPLTDWLLSRLNA